MLSINRSAGMTLGVEWIRSSFFIFREKPLQFIVLGISAVIAGILPFLGAFMTPLFVAKFAILTRKVEKKQTVLFSSIFEGFFANRVVIKLAFINFLINATILCVQYLIEPNLKDIDKIDVTSPHSITVLLLFVPIILLQISMWLSPLICLFHNNISPFQAMWLSFKACSFNIVTLLLYSLLVIIFTLIAILPLCLGLLIWVPMLNIIVYFIYKSLIIPNTKPLV